jgi:hypothetical protein
MADGISISFSFIRAWLFQEGIQEDLGVRHLAMTGQANDAIGHHLEANAETITTEETIGK